MDPINTASHPAASLTRIRQWSAVAPSEIAHPVSSGQGDQDLRRRVGEFVGDIFYGTLIRQMHASKLKGDHFHGGRGEEVFQGQMGMELAKRMGRAANDPISNRLYESLRRHMHKNQTTPGPRAAEDPGSSGEIIDRVGSGL